VESADSAEIRSREISFQPMHNQQNVGGKC